MPAENEYVSISRPLPLRWRLYEVVAVTIMFVLVVVDYLLQADHITLGEMFDKYLVPYGKVGLSFNYGRNVLMPRLCVTGLFYISYLLINYHIIRKQPPIPGTQAGWLQTGMALVKLVVLSYCMALGVNIATYYAHPYLFHYAGFKSLSLFGYNDRPMTNLFAGFGRALALTGSYAAYAWLRQLLCRYLEKPQSRNEYHLLVARQVGTLLLVCLALYGIISSYTWMDRIRNLSYITLVAPVLLVNIVNIFWLFPRVHHLLGLFRRGILIRMLAATFVCSLPILLNPLVVRVPALFPPYWFVMVGVVTPLSWLWYQARKEKIMEIKGLQKALSRSKADIGLLRSQINPHFLFNTLNTLYGTALQENAGRTATGIQKLGDMMRFMLHDNHQDFIPMQRELEYLQHYIDIQQLRIQSSPHINIQNNIRDAQCHHVIAPMLLIPLVENAFKHGISLVERSWIQVKLDCDATTIRFEVRNSMHRQQPAGAEKDRSGTGITNMKERLHLVYPGRHQFICFGDGDTFSAELIIQP